MFADSPIDAGDTNGDGYSDLLLPAHGTNHSDTRLLLFYGEPTAPRGPIVTIESPSPGPIGDRFGGTAVAAGDVNGDGYADLAAIVEDGLPSLVLALYRGSAAGLGATPSQLITLPIPGGAYRLGELATGFDLNGDGYGDLLIVLRQSPQAYEFLGSPDGWPSAASATLEVPEPPLHATSAGDVNDDGYADVLLGIIAGHVGILFGGPSAIDPTTRRVIASVAGPGVDTYPLLGVGDVDGDGFGDVVGRFVGPGTPRPPFLWFGGPEGLAESRGVSLVQATHATNQAGWFRWTAGDYDGDGVFDVAFGFPAGAFNDASGDGEVIVMRGGSRALTATWHLIAPSTPSPSFGVWLAEWDLARERLHASIGYERTNDRRTRFGLTVSSTRSGSGADWASAAPRTADH